MAVVKPPHVVLVDSPPSRDEHNGGWSWSWRQRRADMSPACKNACLVGFCLILAAAVVTGLVFLEIFLKCEFPSGDPVYSVAITGVAGLDPAALDDAAAAASDGRPPTPTTLSPVFNLTFQIDNTRNSKYAACVPGLSTAAVSYGDAFLARGSVEPFCAKEKRHSQRVAVRAWGDAVRVPGFLRDQLAAELAAGDASVDVKVTMPSGCKYSWCADAVLSCRAMIGGGPLSPCRMDFI